MLPWCTVAFMVTSTPGKRPCNDIGHQLVSGIDHPNSRAKEDAARAGSCAQLSVARLHNIQPNSATVSRTLTAFQVELSDRIFISDPYLHSHSQPHGIVIEMNLLLIPASTFFADFTLSALPHCLGQSCVV